MKIEKQINSNQYGSVKIIPEQSEDLWIVYHVIQVGDLVTAQTTRKIQRTTGKDDASGAKGRNPSRVRANVEIVVAAVDYTGAALALRVRGKIRSKTQFFEIGSSHTLELGAGKEFTLYKEVWDSGALEILENGRNGKTGYDLGVLLIREGSAQIILVGNGTPNVCSRIEEKPNPKLGHSKFFGSVFAAVTKHIDFDLIHCVVISSPGSIKHEFRSFMLSEARRLGLKSIEKNKSRMILATASSLTDIANDKAVMDLIKETKSATKTRTMRKVMEAVVGHSDKVCYGLRSVEAAEEGAAIDTLVISDELLRGGESWERKKYENLVKSVKEAGGTVLVVSSLEEVWAEELAKLTGIAALLRFPMPELDELALVNN